MKSKIANSGEIGSKHWAATLLSFVMHVGEYLELHEDGGPIKPSERMHYKEWGTGLRERAVEINNYFQSRVEPKEEESQEVIFEDFMDDFAYNWAKTDLDEHALLEKMKSRFRIERISPPIK